MKSFKNLIGRMEDSVSNGFKWIFTKIKNFFLGIFNFFVQNVFFMRGKNLKSKYQAVKMVMSAAVILLLVSLYPLLKVEAPKAL